MKITETFNIAEIAGLAVKLKTSTDPDVVKLCEGVLELEAAYGQLKNRLVEVTSELVSVKHKELLTKLADGPKNE